MPAPREFIFGPWRAVSVLGVTQIITWGAMFYPPVLTVPLIAADHGWSIAFSMGGFSLALFVGGMVSRYVGGFIDRYGGHAVMPFGSLIGAAGLFLLVQATHWIAYLAVWMVIGVAMAARCRSMATISGPGCGTPVMGVANEAADGWNGAAPSCAGSSQV